MFDVITLGSATKDIFIEASKFKKGNDLSFPLGEKIELEKVLTSSGGGGVNTATTFVRQGLKTAFCGVVGQDLAGQEILDELYEKGVETNLVRIKPRVKTDLGLIFHAGTERTILLYHSAAKTFSEKDIDVEMLAQARWLYLAPLWGRAAKLTSFVLGLAKHKIKIAFNPSLEQLRLKNIKEIIGQADVLLLNEEEAAFLTGIRPHKNDENETQKLLRACVRPGLRQPIAVITKGKNGAAAFDGKFLYQVEAPRVKVVDATGAGDSFGSGFVAGLIKRKSVEDSLKLAMANAVANIQVFGANQGLLKINDQLPEIKITKTGV